MKHRRRVKRRNFDARRLSTRADAVERVTLLVALEEENGGEDAGKPQELRGRTFAGVRFDQGLWNKIYVLLRRRRFPVLTMNSCCKKIRGITTRIRQETTT